MQGFEATSISQIADAVGVRKASLYSHFESKRAILDALTKDILEHDSTHSFFSETNEADPGHDMPLTADAAEQMIQGQIHYILHDPHISRARKMLVLEQFRNPELAKLQTKQNHTDVMRCFTRMIRQMILPVSAWINLCDRERDRVADIMELVGRHVRQFFKVYQAEVRSVHE